MRSDMAKLPQRKKHDPKWLGSLEIQQPNSILVCCGMAVKLSCGGGQESHDEMHTPAAVSRRLLALEMDRGRLARSELHGQAGG